MPWAVQIERKETRSPRCAVGAITVNGQRDDRAGRIGRGVVVAGEVDVEREGTAADLRVEHIERDG